MGTPISVKPETGQPWRDRFSPASLVVETRMLQTACFLVVTYLSGMRVDEVLALRAGCCHQDITADGLKLSRKSLEIAAQAWARETGV